MASNISLNIVDNDLILYLDASNFKSYVGTGSSWLDLSREKNDSTLNGTNFSLSNGGSVNLNGTTDYCITGLTSNPSDFSIECTFSFNSITLGLPQAVYGKYTTGDQYWMGLANDSGIVFLVNQDVLGSGVIAELNRIYSITCVSSTIQREIWIDGELQNTKFATASAPGGNLVIGDHGLANIPGPGIRSSVNINSFRFYSRKLTSQEIQQNYLSAKKRFGI